jgi:hypothetical protein
VPAQAETLASRYLISGVVRQASDAGQTLFLDEREMTAAIARAPSIVNPLDVANRVFLDILAAIPAFGQPGALPARNFARYFLRNKAEFRAILDMLAEQHWIKLDTNNWEYLCTPTPFGWERADELRSAAPRTDQAFVAMRFTTAMTPAFGAIQRACRRCGYNGLRIDLEEHNDLIIDRIIGEIRRSAFFSRGRHASLEWGVVRGRLREGTRPVGDLDVSC